ncbi:protocatechuate 3,4-dioxygenase subunit alpha [Telmatospirillum siberiense]|uniref:Protocatechuate 3,4-dioxygenase subunit alpha n=1 Tax=Telmatospirillum siberiense TaxID=382514 RepID=A0A2N3PUT5_9PROT|nr:protocatechuate 3,4-dioxygenase subunit alpha [Telmatospirillum siberiense]PKU24157.1 protocatechuate 3,4-dioxygenase subunit alpha [Telmatospirillum siberiense]
MSLQATTSQTVGPYLHLGLSWLNTDEIAPPGMAGRRVRISGRIIDGEGALVPDAMLEIWQADHRGRFAHPEDARAGEVEPGFRGFGRVPTDAEGAFRFQTIKPGRVPGPGGGWQAPHLLVSIFARGLLKHLVSRLYFPDEPDNASDPILALVDPERRDTLIARAAGDELLEWDIVLQGPRETVFFEF